MSELTDETSKKLNAYAALVKSQEGQISALRRAHQAGIEAVNTLQSERLANMMMTAELAEKDREIAALQKRLAYYDTPGAWVG